MRKLLLAPLVIGPLLLASWVGAQPARLPTTLEGSWRLTVSPARAHEIALAAFRPRIDALPSFVRGMVRERIHERMDPVRRMEIELDGDRVRVVSHGRREVVIETTTLPGTTHVVGSDGERRRVTQRVRGGWLEQVIDGENGEVRRLLSTEPDGQTLHVDVTVSNERLGAPVRWRLDFRR